MSTNTIKTLLELIEKEKDKDVKASYSYQLVSEVGAFDNAKRYQIIKEFETESSSAIRSPSRSWPFSKLKHVYTRKYQAQLLDKLNQFI
jgi:hypothetical protein